MRERGVYVRESVCVFSVQMNRKNWKKELDLT